MRGDGIGLSDVASEKPMSERKTISVPVTGSDGRHIGYASMPVNDEGKIDIAPEFDERLSRLERKLFPPDCPTRYRTWFVYYVMAINRGVSEHSGRKSTIDEVAMFDGVPMKFCPFCGETLPHKDVTP